jgi:hypothetical protein
MCAVYAQCASVHPIRLFYLTKWEAPYKGYSQSAAWGVILSVGRDGKRWTRRSRLEGAASFHAQPRIDARDWETSEIAPSLPYTFASS